LGAVRNVNVGTGRAEQMAQLGEKSEDSGLWSLLSLFPFCYVASNASTGSETKVVHLRSDVPEGPLPKPAHDLGEHDTIDTTLGPTRTRRGAEHSVMTPRQHCFKEGVQLPKLLRYPSLPKDFMVVEDENGEQQEREVLLKLFQEFALDMHRGRYLTQLGSNQDYSVIHCQVMDDLQTLKVDQGNGCIIEFPLTGVSKVYRIVKTDERLLSNSASVTTPNIEHIVVVEFTRRKLAFVFAEVAEAQRFLICMELLIRRAQETRELNPLDGPSRVQASVPPLPRAAPGLRLVRPLLSTPEAKPVPSGVECVCKPPHEGY